MIITMILIFVFGYLCIALEHKLRIDKAAIALLMCGALWTVLSLLGNDAQIGTQLIEQLGDTSEILFFLIGAMTIVELIDRERQNQNLLCYHYTIVQSDARKQVQRYGKESIFQKKSSANGRGSKKNSTERGKFGSKSPDTLTTAQGLRRFDSIDKIDNSMQ